MGVATLMPRHYGNNVKRPPAPSREPPLAKRKATAAILRFRRWESERKRAGGGPNARRLTMHGAIGKNIVAELRGIP